MKTDSDSNIEFRFKHNIAEKSYAARYAFNFGLNTGGSLSEFSKIYKEYGFNLENISNYILQYSWGKDERESILGKYKECFEIDSNRAEAYYNRGGIKFYVKDYAGAILEYNKAIEFNPHYDFAYNGRGICKCFHEDYEGGIQDFKIAFSLNNKNQNAKYNLEIAYDKVLLNSLEDAIKQFDNKNYKEAIVLFKSYLQNSKPDSVVWFMEDVAEAYLFFYLKAHDATIKLNTDNLYYITLDTFIGNYHKSIERKEQPTEDEENASKMMIYYPKYKLGFGIYKGQMLKDIIQKDPSYILQCILTLHHFCIGNFLLYNISKTNETDYIKAVELNIIKIQLINKWHPLEEEDNYDDFERDTFDAMTDGQLGDFDDFDGDIDDVMSWGGRE